MQAINIMLLEGHRCLMNKSRFGIVEVVPEKHSNYCSQDDESKQCDLFHKRVLMPNV